MAHNSSGSKDVYKEWLGKPPAKTFLLGDAGKYLTSPLLTSSSDRRTNSKLLACIKTLFS